MSKKPMVRCPHCEEHVQAKRLLSQRKYRNDFGLDVFECPECQKEMKFEPSEYLATRERVERGEVPEEVAIQGAKVEELLPSEKMAINYNRIPRAPWRGPAKIASVVLLLILVYLIFG